ncbi:MAG: hypothetical protein SNH55_04115 [Rikenellaceae bacterium]
MDIKLIGKWLFIGAERYHNNKWQPCSNYVEGMTWTFHPQYFGKNKVIGCIIESTANTTKELAYSYNTSENRLKIEIFTDCIIGIGDESEVDIYEIITNNQDPKYANQIIISILTMEGYPPPYFRYILHKVLKSV